MGIDPAAFLQLGLTLSALNGSMESYRGMTQTIGNVLPLAVASAYPSQTIEIYAPEDN